MSKWPRKVKHRNKVLAKIYRPCGGRESYRVCWYAAGARQRKSFRTYTGKGGAKEYAEELVKDLYKNSQATMLTPAQATDALAALERLNSYFQATGRRVSLLAAVSDFCDGGQILGGHSHWEAAKGFLRTVASVHRKGLSDAVEKFIAAEEPHTRAGNGQRAQLSAKYHYNRFIMLRRFGAYSRAMPCATCARNTWITSSDPSL